MQNATAFATAISNGVPVVCGPRATNSTKPVCGGQAKLDAFETPRVLYNSADLENWKA